MNSYPAISILGPGKVGTAIGALARRAGWPIAAVGGRRREAAEAAARYIESFENCQSESRAGGGCIESYQSQSREGGRCVEGSQGGSKEEGRRIPAFSLAEAARLGQLILLTVSDNAIESVCAELAQEGAFAQGAIVAHCSGALDSSILASARGLSSKFRVPSSESPTQSSEFRVSSFEFPTQSSEFRVSSFEPRIPSPEPRIPIFIASFHPLQTFPTPEAAIARLPGAWCFCEGDEAALKVLKQLAGALGCRFARINAENKIYYHIAAVMACNYMTALADAAFEMAERAGIPRETALQAFAPIMSATLDNIVTLGPGAALTGPIARGDSATIERHLAALQSADPEIQSLYRAAGAWAYHLAGKAPRPSM
ncbi:MAG: DUF2520 domain-containing protein [Candidatus Sumerlaeota bacterium]|nr:DUF2520 domain-containing protein [Candidatus Sumerlaeota bacterium]